MVTVQLALTPSVRPHVLVWVNSGAELTVSPVMLSEVVPVLVNVNTCDDVPDTAVGGKMVVPFRRAVVGVATSKAVLVADTLFAAILREAVKVSAA